MKIKTHFSPENTFLNGQCFRWNKKGDYFEGIVDARLLRVEKKGEYLIIEGLDEKELPRMQHYLGFEEGLEEKERQIAQIDSVMKAAVFHGKGMHLLRQDPFETLISFIISSNNHISRIKGLVEKLAVNYGQEIDQGYYSFPGAQALARASIEDLRALGLGYRDKYVLDGAKQVAQGKVDLASLYSLNTSLGIKELEKIKGVGKKVASCVLLFAFGKGDSFPVDTWIKKALTTHYPEEISKYPDVDTFLSEYFGKEAGLAQQYLFHYMRTGRKE